MTFLETPRFPEGVAEGAAGGPVFITYVFACNAGLEQRHSIRTIARHEYDVSLGIRDQADMADVRDFFTVIQGRKNSFRFKDWNDYQLDQELIATGDGTTDTFPLTKTYTTGAYSYVRRIRKPVSGTAQVYVNDVLQLAGYTLDYTTGELTFLSAPANGETIKVSCEFDVPVRFDVDSMSASHVGFEAEDWSGVGLVEDLNL